MSCVFHKGVDSLEAIVFSELQPVLVGIINAGIVICALISSAACLLERKNDKFQIPFIGGRYVLINQGQASAGYTVVPGLWTMICLGVYRSKR